MLWSGVVLGLIALFPQAILPAAMNLTGQVEWGWFVALYAHVAIPGLKVLALLADLLVHADEPLTADRLIDDLWGRRPAA